MAKRQTIPDPAAAMNKRVLAQREERIKAKQLEDAPVDLGLNLMEESAEAPDAASLLRDEWDKKTFGNAPKTTTRVIYGPDPIVNNCPEFHERLERHGLEAVAEAFKEHILKSGEFAATDPIMRKGLRLSIAKFGKEATANAFFDRVMSIPYRTVEVEIDEELDPMLVNPMREAVARYGRPGMSVKFLSDRCMSVLGRRGYEIIKDERGDPVRIGTLFMGEIPEYMAQRRIQHFADLSQSEVNEQEEAFMEQAERTIRDSKTSGVAPLQPGDMIERSSQINDKWLDDQRQNGVRIGRGSVD